MEAVRNFGANVEFLERQQSAYTSRYLNFLSNSTRVFANFGDDPNGSSNGFALISENSLVSGLPSTLVPYANVFVGVGNPQPLVDGNGAGILKNVGINFETDALTGYPKLDDSGSNAFGGALGIEYPFNLDQQIAFEVAMVQPFEGRHRGSPSASGLRRPISDPDHQRLALPRRSNACALRRRWMPGPSNHNLSGVDFTCCLWPRDLLLALHLDDAVAAAGMATTP